MTTGGESQRVLVRLHPGVDCADLSSSHGIEFQHLVANHYVAALTPQQIEIARKHPAVEAVLTSEAKFTTASAEMVAALIMELAASDTESTVMSEEERQDVIEAAKEVQHSIEQLRETNDQLKSLCGLMRKEQRAKWLGEIDDGPL
jgi:hypothetical protein